MAGERMCSKTMIIPMKPLTGAHEDKNNYGDHSMTSDRWTDKRIGELGEKQVAGEKISGNITKLKEIKKI